MRKVSAALLLLAALAVAPTAPQVRIRNVHSGKVLAVAGMSTADSAPVTQYDDNGTEDHRWVLLVEAAGTVRIRNVHSGKVLAVHDMSTADSANVEQFSDNGTADHRWKLTT